MSSDVHQSMDEQTRARAPRDGDKVAWECARRWWQRSFAFPILRSGSLISGTSSQHAKKSRKRTLRFERGSRRVPQLKGTDMHRLLFSICAVAVMFDTSALAQTYNPVVTSDRTGFSGTTPGRAWDGNNANYFHSSYNDWQ